MLGVQQGRSPISLQASEDRTCGKNLVELWGGTLATFWEEPGTGSPVCVKPKRRHRIRVRKISRGVVWRHACLWRVHESCYLQWEPGKGLEKGDGQDQGYTWKKFQLLILMHERGCHRDRRGEPGSMPSRLGKGHEGMNQSGRRRRGEVELKRDKEVGGMAALKKGWRGKRSTPRLGYCIPVGRQRDHSKMRNRTAEKPSRKGSSQPRELSEFKALSTTGA